MIYHMYDKWWSQYDKLSGPKRRNKIWIQQLGRLFEGNMWPQRFSKKQGVSCICKIRSKTD